MTENTSNPLNVGDIVLYSEKDLPYESQGALRVVYEDQISFSLLRTWLADCEQGHGPNCCQPKFSSSADQSKGILLVDVQANCIIRGSLEDRYLCLSYVWGGVEQLQLTQDNYTKLTATGGVTRHSNQIPRTIKDAIQLVSEMGESYLWVDSLCIVQDDIREKQSQINQMANIYDSAILTIVACSGSHANAPLPGVRKGTRGIKPISRQPGFAIAKTRQLGLIAALPQTHHHSRAWTYQEVILSRRCLFFLDDQVYFQCQQAGFKESLHSKTSHGTGENRLGNYPPLTADFPPAPIQYEEILLNFSARNITFASDRLNAFSGVAKALHLLRGWKFSYGLPAELFDIGLLWTPGDPRAWPYPQYAAQGADARFPSWSWLSYAGLVSHPVLHRSTPISSLVDWGMATVWDGERSWNVQDGGEKMAGESGGGVDALMEGKPPGLLVFMAWKVLFSADWVGRSTMLDEHLERKVAERAERAEDDAAPTQICAPLTDKSGVWCGVLTGITHEDITTLLEEGNELELVLLSAMNRNWSSKWITGTQHGPIKECFDETKLETGEWKTVNVMLVKRNERTSIRLAVGEIHIVSWKESDPEPDLIWLV